MLPVPEVGASPPPPRGILSDPGWGSHGRRFRRTQRGPAARRALPPCAPRAVRAGRAAARPGPGRPPSGRLAHPDPGAHRRRRRARPGRAGPETLARRGGRVDDRGPGRPALARPPGRPGGARAPGLARGRAPRGDRQAGRDGRAPLDRRARRHRLGAGGGALRRAALPAGRRSPRDRASARRRDQRVDGPRAHRGRPPRR